MATDIAGRRRSAISRGARFIWDKTIDTEGRVTGVYGFVQVGPAFYRAGVHETEIGLMTRMVEIAEEKL